MAWVTQCCGDVTRKTDSVMVLGRSETDFDRQQQKEYGSVRCWEHVLGVCEKRALTSLTLFWKASVAFLFCVCGSLICCNSTDHGISTRYQSAVRDCYFSNFFRSWERDWQRVTTIKWINGPVQGQTVGVTVDSVPPTKTTKSPNNIIISIYQTFKHLYT